jgi:iron complex outermembrane receptor protein
MKPLFTRIIFCLAFTVLANSAIFGQPDTASAHYYDGLSLKDLLDIKIVTVSKNSERLFDAALSASVVTKEDIQKAGATSIMEALRLVPGMLVREQTNGNFDIYLRGMDNVPLNGPFDGNSTTTLVMIDNRPIYNYLKGGTFWETLPIDINDVEKIEVVRGPAAALYGPNAVSGVINIITRETTKQGLYLVANTQHGSGQTYISNASVGYQSKKFSVITSGNYQGRNRSQTSYYEIYRNAWLDKPQYMIGSLNDTVYNISQMYPKQEQAMEKYAGNVFFNYTPREKIAFHFAAGTQHSMVQKVSSENGMTPLTTVVSNSRYADLRANLYGISSQFSYNEGTQLSNLNPGNKYDFNSFDANFEYNYTLGNLSLQPGLSYRSAIYDDTKYSDIINKTGIFNARGQIITKSASLRGEYTMLDERIRLVAGLTTNTFNYPDTTYLSYQFATTYKLNKNHLFRAVYSRAPRSATIYDNYVNQQVSYFQTGYQNYLMLALEGNKHLQLLTADMLEIGYRGKLTSKLYIDAELFNIRSKNYNSIVTSAAYKKLSGSDTITVVPLVPTNLPTRLLQQGVTLSLHYKSDKLQVKPFITIQRSTIKDYSAYSNTPDATAGPIQNDPLLNNIYSGIGTASTLESTPEVFGGGSVNYTPASKININMSAYYYTSQTYHHVSNVIFNDGVRGIDHLNSKLILNASVSYEPVKGLRFFWSGKNLFNNRSREFFMSDDIPFSMLAGISYEL